MLQSFFQVIESRDREVARATDYDFVDLRTLSARMERLDSLLIGVRNCLGCDLLYIEGRRRPDENLTAI